jgi:hypothetical protein
LDIKYGAPSPSWLKKGGHWGELGDDTFKGIGGVQLPGTDHRIYDLFHGAFPHPQYPRGTGRIITNDDGQRFFTPDHYTIIYEIDEMMFNIF